MKGQGLRQEKRRRWQSARKKDWVGIGLAEVSWAETILGRREAGWSPTGAGDVACGGKRGECQKGVLARV